MPQSRFLDFMTREAQRFPSFRLKMGARVEELLETDGVVAGVRYRAQDGWHELRALQHVEMGVAQARRAWLTKDQVLNTRTWAQIKKLQK